MSKAPMPDTVKGDAPMPSSFDDDLEFWDEGRWSKLGRRLKEEPLIPFGLALTCWALYSATKSIRKGDKTQTNRFFRMRVYAQGFTLLCLCAGSIYWKEDREKRKYYEGLLGEKRAKEKRDAWIRELEARDEEDKLERTRRQTMREAKKQGKSVEEIEKAGQQEVEKALKKRAQLDSKDAKSPLEADPYRLFLNSAILGPAMSLWWSRK